MTTTTPRRTAEAYAITQPVIIRHRADMASLLRANRIALGMTCEQFDAHAGFADRYVTKMENGSEYTGGRRQGLHVTPPTTDDPEQGRTFSGDITLTAMAELWLEASGLHLMLVPASLAASIGAVPAPERVVGKGA